MLQGVDVKIVPAIIAASSLVALGIQLCVCSSTSDASQAWPSRPYNVLRLIGCFCLLSLSVTSFLSHPVSTNLIAKLGPSCIAENGVYLYALFLALLVLRTERYAFAVHLNLILLVQLAVYVARDVVPLATYTGVPLDNTEGWLLWAKISLLVVTAIGVPSFIPRKYVPLDPKNPMPTPNPEQTASFISLVFFSFLDYIVFAAYRMPHFPYDRLPPLADYDYLEVLRRRSFPHLDPHSGAKKSHIFFGLVRVFRRELTVMAAMLVILLLAELASPIGINRLLRYLEKGGAGEDIRPWVWILLLFIGPLSGAIAFEWYIYTTTWILVKTEAIITELVFEHSLRIRLKSEAPVESKPLEDNDPQLTRSPEGAYSADAESATEVDTSLSREQSSQSTTSDNSSLGKAKQQVAPAPPASAIAKPHDDGKNLIGRINTLITTDLQNITDAREFLRVLITVPVQVTLCIIFLYQILGWSAFVGLATMVLLLPLPGFLAKRVQTIQKEGLKKTDARIQTVTEAMNVIRMIKLFGWEVKMNDRISDKREEELHWIFKRQLTEMLSSITNYVIPSMTMLMSYLAYLLSSTVIMKMDLTASVVFSSMAIFSLLRNRLNTILFLLNVLVTGKVSLDRVNDFLNNTELLDSFSEKTPNETAILSTDAAPNVIGVRNAAFTWSNDATGTETPSKRNFRLQVDGEVIFRPGCINLIVGPTGSGKTSLLLALLGEMHYIPSGPDSWCNLPRGPGISYASQETWVFNDTIKNNILFHSPWDEERYRKVLYACALEPDLAMFDAGDATEVGEKGLTLSGGQKARITLARAIYSPSNVVLLDDILAALDVHTSSWIVTNCLGGDLIKGRTVLLITHNVAMVSRMASFAVSVRDGHIVMQGTVTEVLGGDAFLGDQAAKEQQVLEKVEEEIDDINPQTATEKAVKAEGKLIVAEEVELGHVAWASVQPYLSALGGGHRILFFLLYFTGCFGHEIFFVGMVWYLGFWASQNEQHPGEVSPYRHLAIYTAIMLISMGMYVISFYTFVYGAIRASRVIHRQLVQAVLGTTLRWLDTTPISRVITRCTQDIRAVDGPVSQNLNMLLGVSIAMLVEFGAVFVITPQFLIVGAAVAAVGRWCGDVYIKAQISVKREMSNAKAPILGHFGAAIIGLVSIRAYGVQDIFIQESFSRTNRYTRAARTFYNLNRWIGVRLSLIGGVFSASLAVYLVYFRPQSPGNTGFSLNMAVSFSSQILWWVRILNSFEVSGNSLERIEGYTKIEQEPKPTVAGVPPAYWPASGDLRIERLSARYSSDGPKVLQDISFNVNSGERIGIVGRTASGKSTLTLSLLRAIFTEGNVHYDGLNIAQLNLDTLRSNITIIPQIPELLSGSLRENLDPFGQHDDATLHNALRAAGLYSLQNETDEDRITLDTAIASSGNNLSVGQKQILALARAIIRGTKLLILDEATSAIDYKTDAIIQSSLRNELGRDSGVTLITIAHRLQTIMDADKILVLDAGRLVEYDSPKVLLSDRNSRFRALVDESSDKDKLYAMVETSV